MVEAFWFAMNGLVGVPIAAVVVISARESLRALLALALGFRLFEIKWGVGRRRWEKTIGPVDLVVGAIPVGASLLAESPSAKHHRVARLAQAGMPLVVQLALAVWLHTSEAARFDSLLQGPAPLAGLRLANLVVLAVHALIPFETDANDRSDVRTLLDIAFGSTEAHRHARASYYARYARHWLERGDAERARSILERGLAQLGRDSLIVACQTRVLAQDLDSVVDQGACSNALRLMIEDDAPRRRRDLAPRSVRERLRRSAITALPMALAVLGWSALESEHVARFAHRRLIASGDPIAHSASPARCETELIRWARWTPLFDGLLPRDAETLRDRHGHLASLEHCRGNLESALAHQNVANEAAEQALSRHGLDSGNDPTPWIDDEVRFAELLRQTARLESDRRRFRIALATLGRAASGIEETKNQLEIQTDGAVASSGTDPLDEERARIEISRIEILARMSGN